MKYYLDPAFNYPVDKHLNLSGYKLYKLKFIPSLFPILNTVTILDVSKNEFTTIFESNFHLKYFTSLVALFLNNNNYLYYISPDIIKYIQTLSSINLSGTSILYLDGMFSPSLTINTLDMTNLILSLPAYESCINSDSSIASVYDNRIHIRNITAIRYSDKAFQVTVMYKTIKFINRGRKSIFHFTRPKNCNISPIRWIYKIVAKEYKFYKFYDIYNRYLQDALSYYESSVLPNHKTCDYDKALCTSWHKLICKQTNNKSIIRSVLKLLNSINLYEDILTTNFINKGFINKTEITTTPILQK